MGRGGGGGGGGGDVDRSDSGQVGYGWWVERRYRVR